MLGKSIVGGRVVGRTYEIDFTCNYNNVAIASSSIKASNMIYSCVTFDVNDAQPFDMPFLFGLEFFKTDDYSTLINGYFEPGTPLFGEIAPTSDLPESLEFSVSKCTVEDKNIDQSLEILNMCPVEGVNFEFKKGQSDQTAVMFSFDSFTFPSSEDDAVIDVDCQVNICERVRNKTMKFSFELNLFRTLKSPTNSVECLKVC